LTFSFAFRFLSRAFIVGGVAGARRKVLAE
jgi:hypothetical protein